VGWVWLAYWVSLERIFVFVVSDQYCEWLFERKTRVIYTGVQMDIKRLVRELSDFPWPAWNIL